MEGAPPDSAMMGTGSSAVTDFWEDAPVMAASGTPPLSKLFPDEEDGIIGWSIRPDIRNTRTRFSFRG
jgi:hypothetical protein